MSDYVPTRPSKTKMVWEWNWPTFWSFKHHVQLFDIDGSLSHKGDHSPAFHFLLVVCNLKLLDFGCYNIYHEDEDE